VSSFANSLSVSDQSSEMILELITFMIWIALADDAPLARMTRQRVALDAASLMLKSFKKAIALLPCRTSEVS